MHKIPRGLDLPIAGKPAPRVEEGRGVGQVGITATDFPLMKPRMHVNVGDTVARGQLLFEDRKGEGVLFTSPAAGTVSAINRGAKRALQSVVIELSDAERAGQGDHVTFEHYQGKAVADMDGTEVRALLSESGLWTSFRTRPFGRVPNVTDKPASIFVTAMDTNPLAGSVDACLQALGEEHFKTGLTALKTLTEGKVWLCKGAGTPVPAVDGIHVEEFKGKHPAGLPGTHIAWLDPVGREHTVWHLGYQDVWAIGALLATGQLDVTRIIALGGPTVKNPRLIRARLGVSLSELTAGELVADRESRVISGSILSGRQMDGEHWNFLGRYHTQVSVIPEDRERVFFGWLRPGLNKFSTIRAFASGWLGMGKRTREFNTNTNGSHRAMVPIGMFERVMPLDIMPTFLLRALVVDDVENAEKLGCLELDEEDLALCSFVSPGKEDYGKALRRNLDEIWREG
ncbi:MAG: Na(+)-translocating NADH-quinone reductase subunit A [Myxococcota bacterium]|nr:Na(+)-translocating NADH-quinone reductase subunit A [Myxococcota bacterium]